MLLVKEPPPAPFVSVLGIPVVSWRLPELLQWVDRSLRTERHIPKQIMYANVHTLNLAWNSPALRAALLGADVIYCDGAGVRLGAWLLGGSLPERMTGADWIYDLCGLAEKRQYRLFFLGGEPGVAEIAIAMLRKRFPSLPPPLFANGFFHQDEERSRQLLQRLREEPIDILLVGMGSPTQELWIREHQAELSVPIVWAMGAVMDFVSQRVPRAPRWMCDHHLEWLFRFALEPRRLWGRYITGNFLFLWRVAVARLIVSAPAPHRRSASPR